MKIGKKQIVIGVVVLVAGILAYKFYTKSQTTVKQTPLPNDANSETTADEETAANDAASAEGFLGRSKKKKKHLGTRKERIAKAYVELLRKGVPAFEAEKMIISKIKGNKTSKSEQEAAVAELSDIASTPKETLVEVVEARKVGGGDGFTPQSFVM
jgi:uncharacterized protein YxeA